MPTVQLERPSKTRDVLNVLANAELPLQITAEDPLYGLRSVFLEYRLQLDRPPQRLLLHDAASAVNTVLAPLTGLTVTAAAPGCGRRIWSSGGRSSWRLCAAPTAVASAPAT